MFEYKHTIRCQQRIKNAFKCGELYNLEEQTILYLAFLFMHSFISYSFLRTPSDDEQLEDSFRTPSDDDQLEDSFI